MPTTKTTTNSDADESLNDLLDSSRKLDEGVSPPAAVWGEVASGEVFCCCEPHPLHSLAHSLIHPLLQPNNKNPNTTTTQVFATLVLLTRNRGQVDLRWVVLRIVLEFLQLFRVVFNTTFEAWSIRRGNPVFQAIRWVLIRGLVMHKPYEQYIKVFYAISAIVLVSLLLAAWLAVVLKKDDAAESGWMGK